MENLQKEQLAVWYRTAIATVCIGITGDLLLRSPTTPRLGLSLWLAVIATGWVMLERRRSVIAPAIMTAIALLTLVNDSDVLLALDYGIGIIFFISVIGSQGKLSTIRLLDVLRGSLTVFATPAGAVRFMAEQPLTQSTTSKKATMLAFIRGIMIAIPFVFIFGVLLVNADAAFANMLTFIFDEKVIDSIIEHSIGIVFFTLAGILLLCGLLTHRPNFTIGLPRSPKIGGTEVITALSILNGLFGLFVAVQFRYFFGGVGNLTEFTYSEYARRGFFELVWVSMLCLPLLLGSERLISNNAINFRKSYRILAGIMILLLAAIMTSAGHRMWLYIQQYGLTELRLYTSVFMIWLGFVFMWFAATILAGKPARFLFGALSAAAVFLVGLHCINPDALIVRVNFSRTDNNYDTYYLVESLSADAVPALIGSLDHLSPAQRLKTAELLLHNWNTTRIPDDWRSWSFSIQRAYTEMKAHEQEFNMWIETNAEESMRNVMPDIAPMPVSAVEDKDSTQAAHIKSAHTKRGRR